jgi:hypothetical protein
MVGRDAGRPACTPPRARPPAAFHALAWAALWTGASAWACVRQEVICPAGSNAPAVTTSALTNAADTARYLALEPWEEAAVVRLGISVAGQRETCSAVLVSGDRVLTAAHCLTGVTATADVAVEVVVGGGDAAAWTTVPRGWTQHPSLDLALIEIAAVPNELTVGSIPTAAGPPAGLVAGADVQLAGFGADEDGHVGKRHFGVELVSSVEPTGLIVTADGASGACGGDSGGPALMRGDDGQVVVVGVLSGGAASCYGTDSYVRVDAAAAWLNEHIPATDPVVQRVIPPGATRTVLADSGRCFGNTAAWLAGGVLQGEVCGGGRVCGWDRRAAGFRCVDPAEDACGGISELGTCDGSTSVRCVDGQVARSPCAACGLPCGRSSRTGAFVCTTG